MSITSRILAAALLSLTISTAFAAPPAQPAAAASHAEDFRQTMVRVHALMAADPAGVEQRLRAMIRAHAEPGADPTRAEEEGLRHVHQIMAEAQTSPEALAHLKLIIAAITAPA